MHPLEKHFRQALTSPEPRVPPPEPVQGLRSDHDLDYWALFEAQATSRHLDFLGRELQQQGRGFYTISSAGHESNAMVAMASRPTDPALLHYRSGGFYLARARQVPRSNPIR